MRLRGKKDVLSQHFYHFPMQEIQNIIYYVCLPLFFFFLVIMFALLKKPILLKS